MIIDHKRWGLAPAARALTAPRRRQGFTLIEACVALAVLSIAMVMLGSTIASSSLMRAEKREASIAAHAARSTLENLRSENFSSLWMFHNASPDDDPGGIGTAPGPHFQVAGLVVDPLDVDGFVGEIVLPNTAGVLREDGQNADLGMPRDLNGDTLIDAESRAADYRILPVLVRLRWQSSLGPRQLEMYSMLVHYEEAP